ncbi:MAG: capsule assembly Wzi family protein, partial [Muribaculaceae bacterium]|nr:capsule assembly Wzi family protein [Muribaculaceae bacterium]
MRPSTIWIQQLYAEVKWRSLFIEAGMRERGSALLNDSLTSGDLVESGNARPIPQLRAGFHDFQAVPLTGGWLEIQGELGYGKFTDGAWMEKFYSHGSYHLNEGAYYLYRRLYFRTDHRKALSLTFGMQAAGEIGCTTRYYEKGKVVRERNLRADVWDMIKMIAPVGGEKSGVGEYMDGNNLGSWDVHARFRLPWGGDVLKAYLQKPWEKGSSLGWKNGFDGLWGIEYDFSSMGGIVSGAVVEYIDFMNQSGAIHYAPHDRPGSTIMTDVSGGDQYYNNSEYNSYTNYGLGIGTPFLVSPRYNRDGYPAYIDNRVRGFHAAVAGRPSQLWDYRLAFSYKRGYGDGRQPKATVSDGVSWLAEVSHA